MYKITNKETGFFQYMSAKDFNRFADMNGLIKKGRYFADKYKFERIKEIDTEFIEEISYAVIGGIFLCILLTLFYIVSL